MFKKLINNIVNAFSKPNRDIAFLTIDHNSVTVSLYEKKDTNQINKLLYENTKEVKGFNPENIISPSLLAHSIAECIDVVEEYVGVRIKNIILTLIGFNSKYITYPLTFKIGEEVNFQNLLSHINPREIKYYLGEDYILTNLIPLNTPPIKGKSMILKDTLKINFLVAGFKKDYIFSLLDIFYNLSLTIDNILFTGAIVPFIFNDNNLPVILVGPDYTLLYSKEDIVFLNEGTNTIFHNISKKTNIPYDILKKNGYLIKDVLTNELEAPLYKVEDFFIQNVKNVVKQSIEEYKEEIISLITSKNLNKHGKIIMLNNNLKWLKEQGLLSSFNLLNITFNNSFNNKFLNYELNNTQIINKAAGAYYNTNREKDYGIISFKKNINSISQYFMTIKE